MAREAYAQTDRYSSNSQSGGERGGDRGKKVFFRAKKDCPLSGDSAPKIDYKDIRLLSRFVSERGKMIPRRITSVCAKKQRELARAIKRARELALLPFVSK